MASEGRGELMEILPHEKEVHEVVQTIERLKNQGQHTALFENEIKKLELKLIELKKGVYSKLTPWQRVTICRHPKRPHAIDYILGMTKEFIELFGDRCFADDSAIVGGLATIEDVRCVIIGQEKGQGTEERLKRNFGMPHPEGFRKALRLMKLAEKFSLPVVTLVDTPGAYPGLQAEERGQGLAIALNLREMASLKTPIISLIIGEGCSGGALGLAVADTVAMLEHSYYSVISPEGCASILWKESSKNIQAATELKMHPENLQKFHLIDAVIEEPLGGAHHAPSQMIERVKHFIVEQTHILKSLSKEFLLEQRYLKFRRMGCTQSL
jgi:acetyl-CoA carboxylase carboxyl transferase subunit alpha